MREKVLQYVRERALLRAGDRVAVAVSGGADSVALLRLLLELKGELGIVISVAHFNHGLRGEQSDADEAFVGDLAKHSGLEFFVGRGDVRDHALTSKLGLEAAGHELRYGWFAPLAEEQRLDAIATAHTLDDQAETVLLKFLRGAGTRGLAGIFPVLALSREIGAEVAKPMEAANGAPEGAPLQRKERLDSERDTLAARLNASSAGAPRPCKVIRPLLCITRQEVEAYLTALSQGWREDESNLDRRFLRNRVRHELLPLLEREFNPNIREALSDLAEIARGEEEFWRGPVERELSARLEGKFPGLKPIDETGFGAGPKAWSATADARSSSVEDGSSTEPAGLEAVDRRREFEPGIVGRKQNSGSGHEAASEIERFDLEGFAALPLGLQRRVLKTFAARQQLTLDFEHVERLRRCVLGEPSKTELPGGIIAARVGGALVLRPPSALEAGVSYRYLLPIPGEVHIAESKLTVRAEIVSAEFAPEVAPGELLSLELVGPELVVRNWLPGDRFWPAHSGSEEKLKRLFAEKRVPAADRPGWLVVLNGDAIVWVHGFPAANKYQWRGEGAAVRIEAISG